MRTFLLPALVLAGFATLMTPSDARASWEATNGAGTCQGALPAFAGTLRARPMAIGNEGASTAFVTCSLDAGSSGSASKAITSLSVALGNSGSTTLSVTCTLVDGWSNNATYISKTATLTSAGFLSWLPSELPSAPAKFSMPNLSCTLPPGATIEWVGHNFTAPTS